MKKELIVFSLVLLLSISFISAFSWSDLLPSGITGSATNDFSSTSTGTSVKNSCVQNCLERVCSQFRSLRKNLCLNADFRKQQCEEECNSGKNTEGTSVSGDEDSGISKDDLGGDKGAGDSSQDISTTPCVDAGYKCTSSLRGCGHYQKIKLFCEGDKVCCEQIPYCGDGVCFENTISQYKEDEINCPEDCGGMDNCIDSDGGNNVYVKGITKGKHFSTREYMEMEDYCYEEGHLAEFYCRNDGNNLMRFNYNCANEEMLCVDGRCINESEYFTYSDNLLIDGDFSFQEWAEDDELFMWNSIAKGEWCDRFAKEGFLEIQCNIYGPSMTKTFPRTRVDYNLFEEVFNNTYDSRSSIWFNVLPQERYLLRYDFADCLTRAYVIGKNENDEVIDIKEDFVNECIDGWDTRETTFLIPQRTNKIAIVFEHNGIDYQNDHGLLDNVEFLQVVQGCYDSDVKFGVNDIYQKGYAKKREQKIEDSCQGDYLIEGDCHSNNLKRKVRCENGCYNGVCLEHKYEFRHPNSYITEGDINAIKYLIGEEYWRNESYQKFKKDFECQEVWFINESGQFSYIECFYLDDSPQIPSPEENAYSWHSKAKQDANKMETLALAYLITGNTTYADKAVEFLNAWSNAPYAKGFDSSLIMFTSIFGMNFAADYMYNYGGWAYEDRENYKEWIRPLVEVYRDYPELNNHESWRLLFLISSAQVLEDPELFDSSIRRWKEHISEEMNEEGVLIWEIHRLGEGLWYHFFSEAPSTLVAEIARHNGINLYNYEIDGKSLKLASDFLAPYIIDSSQWPFYPRVWVEQIFALHYEPLYSMYKEDLYLSLLDSTRNEYGFIIPVYWYPFPPTTLINSYSEICEDHDGDGYYTNLVCGSIDCDDDNWDIRECDFSRGEFFFSRAWSRITGRIVDLFS